MFVCVCCVFLYICMYNLKHAVFFHFQCPTIFLYTLDIDLFDKFWYVHMEYSTAVDINELVIHNSMDEFQHHRVDWGSKRQLMEKYMQ